MLSSVQFLLLFFFKYEVVHDKTKTKLCISTAKESTQSHWSLHFPYMETMSH